MIPTKLLFGSHARGKWHQTDSCLLTEQKKLICMQLHESVNRGDGKQEENTHEGGGEYTPKQTSMQSNGCPLKLKLVVS